MHPRRKFSGPSRVAAVAAITSALVATAGLGAGPAQSAQTSVCPSPFPVADLVPGAPVTGLTVTKGTDPDSFAGQVVGVLENGIAPGVDMILVDLDSPTVDRVGIWSGMSGSPVYAANGELIGAVSYSLGLGPSTIAGVTPAADMMKLLDAPTGNPPQLRERVRLPQSLRASLARFGASATAAGQDLHLLEVPTGVSGLSGSRLAKVKPVLRTGDLRVADTPAGPASSEQVGITAGGNLAASLSYGTVTAAAVGTATAVCGSEILGFGHPYTFTGPTTMSLHGARATHIQDDQTLSGFKVANLGKPIGTVDGDRMAGLHAVQGTLPSSTQVSAKSSEAGAEYTADTTVTVPDFMPDFAFLNVLSSQDKVMDRVGKGTAWARWTITGTRKNGAEFSFTRKDLYADSGDVSAAPAFALAGDVSAIQDNPGEVVRIKSVTSESHLYPTYETYVIRKVQARMFGTWIPLSQDEPSPLRAGKTARLKVFLTSREGEPRTLFVRVYVPTHAAGRIGLLDVTGGNDGAESSDEFFDFEDLAFEEATPAPTSKVFPQVLKELAAAPQHNEVVATIRFPHAPRAAGIPRTGSTTMNRVVGGSRQFPIVALR